MTALHATVAAMNGKVDVGGVFEKIFRIYREQFTLLIPAALVIFIPVAILNGVLLASGGLLVALATVAIGTVATYWFQGMVVEAAHDIMDGRRDHTVGSLLASVRPVLLTLVFTGIVAGIAIGIGFVLLIVPGLFLITIWALAAPVVVIERKGVMDSLDRSRKLVRGHGWQVFAVIVVLLLVNIVLGGVVQAILTALSDDVLGYAVSNLLTSVLIGPLTALAAAVLYFELLRLHGETGDASGAVPATVGPEVPVASTVADTPPGQPAPDPAPPPPDPSGPTTPDPRPPTP